MVRKKFLKFLLLQAVIMSSCVIRVITVPEFVTIPKGLTEVNFQFSIGPFRIEHVASITTLIANWVIENDTINLFPESIPESEREALIDLYNSTDGDNWRNNENWLGKRGTECSWHGVYCDATEVHVEVIEMWGNNLNGEILASIGNLQNLLYLNLYNNQLSSLPESFGNLQNLLYLNLYNNQLSSLPESFGNLQNLSELHLSDNQLSSLPESFGNLQNLSDLYLSDNQLSSLPESIGNLQNLSDLYLSYNQLSSLPESIGNLQNLSYLYLSNNPLSSLPESIGNLQNLSDLYLSDNQLSSLPESIVSLR